LNLTWKQEELESTETISEAATDDLIQSDLDQGHQEDGVSTARSGTHHLSGHPSLSFDSAIATNRPIIDWLNREAQLRARHNTVV
jgi:hypothetical protein